GLPRNGWRPDMTRSIGWGMVSGSVAALAATLLLVNAPTFVSAQRPAAVPDARPPASLPQRARLIRLPDADRKPGARRARVAQPPPLPAGERSARNVPGEGPLALLILCAALWLATRRRPLLEAR